MQFTNETIKGLCSNMYCTRGEDGKRKEVAIRDTRGKPEYCSQACAAMTRYKTRYRGTNAGPISRQVVEDKLNNL